MGRVQDWEKCSLKKNWTNLIRFNIVSFSLSTKSHPKDRLSQNYFELEITIFTFSLCFIFIVFSLPWCPFQFRQAGEKCLMFIQRLKTLGESHPPLLPWLITAQQHGASRPAAAADGGTSPPSRRWRLEELAPPLPPQPCANQVSRASCPGLAGSRWTRVVCLEGCFSLNFKN